MTNYTIRQVSRILGLTERTTRQWIHDGKLTAFKLPGGQKWLITEREIERLTANGYTDRESAAGAEAD